METILVKQLFFFYLHSNNLISENQHGFQEKHSTCTQLLECMNDWTLAMDKKYLVDCIYIDYSRAFDSVSHPKLLTKHEAHGITGLPLKWIKVFCQTALFR